jgi:hypothetical protein
LSLLSSLLLVGQTLSLQVWEGFRERGT